MATTTLTRSATASIARLPENGRPREEILASSADGDRGGPFWQTGKCSGTMYCGDMEHYAFLNEAFALYRT